MYRRVHFQWDIAGTKPVRRTREENRQLSNSDSLGIQGTERYDKNRIIMKENDIFFLTVTLG